MAPFFADDDPAPTAGKVLFDQDDELGDVDASDDDVDAIVHAVRRFWSRFLHRDGEGLASLVASGATRLAQQPPLVVRGAHDVVASLVREADTLERSGDLVAAEVTLRSMAITVDDADRASVAVVSYWVDVLGGVATRYRDRGAVLQVFARGEGSFRLEHHTDAWSLEYDLDNSDPGVEGAFSLDLCLPVSDLTRAAAFYGKLLGRSPTLEGDTARFWLASGALVLDARASSGGDKPAPRPRPFIRTEGREATLERLADEGLRAASGTGEHPIQTGSDLVSLFEDPAGNVFGLSIAARSAPGASPSLSGLEGPHPCVASARALWQAYLRADADAVADLHGDEGDLLDDTRSKRRGFVCGRDDIAAALDEVHFACFDQGKDGLAVDMVASDLEVRELGPKTIVSFVRRLKGKGARPVDERAAVTHVFDAPDRIACTFVSRAGEPEPGPLDLACALLPAADIEQVEAFYTDTLGLGEPDTSDGARRWPGKGPGLVLFESTAEGGARPAALLVAQSPDAIKASLEATSAPPVTDQPLPPSLSPLLGTDAVTIADSEGNLLVLVR